ncbi:MAG TPA: sodium:proton antiporter [Candidatus Eremiobacteraceae bacterium]|nr:sodium:proton antiporter [Candidatus Eremiobacteraceae bacterium]
MLVLFGAVLGAAIASRHARIPYTVGLVVMGLIIGALPHHPKIQLTPDLVMLVFLPALLFAGAWTYPTSLLRRNWLPIALLATVGVLISILVSWIVLVRFAGLAPQTALLFGAIVAATDPVSVISVFRAMRADDQLIAIVEGESLFNDATAVIAFKVTLLLSVVTTHVTAAAPLVDFVELLVGGAVVGVLVGVVGLLVLRLTDDYVIEALGSLVIAYGSYFVAEWIHASGLVAVIVAGMFLSRVGSRFGSFTSTRQSVNQLWEFIAFAANSMLFLLVGLAINFGELRSSLVAAAWGIVAIAVARVISVYGLSRLSGLLGRVLPLAWQHIFFLGGLRGALSMALVLSLPASLAQRDLLVAMVFSVVLFTIVAQGLAIAPALLRLRLSPEQAPDRS